MEFPRRQTRSFAATSSFTLTGPRRSVFSGNYATIFYRTGIYLLAMQNPCMRWILLWIRWPRLFTEKSVLGENLGKAWFCVDFEILCVWLHSIP